jgi:hypothetical protein
MDTGTDQIELSSTVCQNIGEAVMHRHVNPRLLIRGVRVLLHEAGHVAQWREGRLAYSEHGAECRALAAMPRALRSLRYSKAMLLNAHTKLRSLIGREAQPYGGTC